MAVVIFFSVAACVRGRQALRENAKVKFTPYFINHNLFIHPDTPDNFDDLYSGINTNSGNGLIATSLAKILGIKTYTGGIKNIFTCHKHYVNFEYANEKYSHAILIFEDHIGEQWNHSPWARMQGVLEALDLPLIVFSLGCCGVNKTPDQVVSEISMEARNFFSFLSRKAVSIGVRGAFTGQVMELLGIRNYQVVGCPTYFEAGRDRVVERLEFTAESAVVGVGLFTSNTVENVHYVLQSEAELLRALIDVAPVTQQDLNSFMAAPWPDYASKLMSALACDRVRFFTDPAEWRDYFDESVALTVGTRVHGSIVSLNKGRPALVTAGDVRAEEMCRLFQIPHLPGAYLADASLAELADMADPAALNAAYPELYDSFMSWLVNVCGLPIPEKPLEFIDWRVYRAALLPGPVAAERLRGASAANEIQRLSLDLSTATSENQRLSLDLSTATSEIQRLSLDLSMELDRQMNLSATLDRLSAQHEGLLDRTLDIERRLALLHQSWSWRLTKPLRWALAVVRKR
ncbi:MULTISPECIES: polysaccharide pyruvyl transferase family protein [unclassified Pseudomonas]|uniref:polysaccharide pyruvyl transferase family protein n=1 Tax=unclassified Pseudomonas TaxID=196821 RepID=UPI002096A2D2|nr:MULTISPECIES: polysaccharide pyruvyl transferase family protein [unclassified Pseudomonas]MCO7519630.1 polysaccharide pyruvyl transferase family protein [Pseudomonas sp. 1]MCO7538930.1 polysaccharide pyruvyl transferase family protein [Pseudomonas sp. VA159-2]